MRDKSILVIGPSGAGKTYAGHTLDPMETIFIVPEGKALPFFGANKNYKTVYRKEPNSHLVKISDTNYIAEDRINVITSQIKLISDRRPEIKTVVIDTFTYALLRTVFDKKGDKTWDKYIDFAYEFKQFIDFTKTLREDLFVILTSHDDVTDDDNGRRTSFKVPAGRFTKEKIVPEGLFTVVLFAEKKIVEDKIVAYFRTQGDSNLPAKSPPGMFGDLLIPNDYQYVRDCYFAYAEGEPAPENKNSINISNSF